MKIEIFLGPPFSAYGNGRRFRGAQDEMIPRTFSELKIITCA